MDFADFDLTISLGDDYRFRITVTLKETGVAVDLTGYQKFWFTAKRSWQDTDLAAILAKDSDSNGVTVITPLAGLVEVRLNAADTASLPNRRQKLYGELQMKDGTGFIESPVRGILTLVPQLRQAIV
jgi:hypothetical protein